ncbi:MAG: hypothetical protein KFB96_01015 [Thiocapsa sp.]|uniref:hypothetical protein n=1 Tax=Thiocapsa sp. TaxID=2024551 RepID=UPI001BD0833A|nr:hypothetical protein [Thiocapsa sp.]QVL49149.1 MAG: hypothetical protein KFB96_01015 [Thiocapsa sp.]
MRNPGGMFLKVARQAPLALSASALAAPRAARPSPVFPSAFITGPTRCMAMDMSEIVGGPPISTGGPAGIGSTTDVGKTSVLVPPLRFGLSLGGGGMPIDWQDRAGRAI